MRRRWLVFGLVAVALLAVGYVLYPSIREAIEQSKTEQAFRAKYGGHKDFAAIMKVVAENQALIAKNPQNDSAYYSLCQGYYALGAFDEAIEACRRAVEIKSDRDYYWSFLGKGYQAKKDYVAAAESYRRALELDPNRKGNYTILAWLQFFRLKQKPEAIELLVKAAERFPTDEAILFDVTRYNLYLKRYDEFLKYAPRYLALKPDDEAMRKFYDDISVGKFPETVQENDQPPAGSPSN